MYCFQPDGSRTLVNGAGGWGVLRGLAFYKDRLFALYSNALTEMTANRYFYRSHQYSRAKTLTEVGDHLYTYEGSQLYEITFPKSSPNKPTKKKLGRFAVTPRVVVGVGKSLVCSENNDDIFAVDVNTGNGEKLPGERNPSAAVYYYGVIYSISEEGDIIALDPKTAKYMYTLTTCGTFKGSRGIAAYKHNLYAIGKDRKFYQISPFTGRVRQRGTGTYTNTGPMIGYYKR